MPDISMCEGGDCPLKDKCYRYKAIPSEFRQAYFADIPYQDDKCEEFWDTEKIKAKKAKFKMDANESKN